MEQKVSKKIVFLDRDGVINKKALDHCYITSVKDFVFNDGIFDLCTQLQQKDFEFIVVTNQRGIARGMYTEEILKEIHDYMKDQFLKRGIPILDVFYCPHENNVCSCRKPKDGMLKSAVMKYPCDITKSILVSDSQEDVRMGETFGIGENIFVTSNKPGEAMIYLQNKKIC